MICMAQDADMQSLRDMKKMIRADNIPDLFLSLSKCLYDRCRFGEEMNERQVHKNIFTERRRDEIMKGEPVPGHQFPAFSVREYDLFEVEHGEPLINISKAKTRDFTTHGQ